jgi:hypothetical protein
MKITLMESMVLQAVSISSADCGEYVSLDAIAGSLPDQKGAEIRRALDGATRKQFIRRDRHGCAAMTEGGAAVLKSV